MIISSIVDLIPLSLCEFLYNFCLLFTKYEPKFVVEKGLNTLYGYSCRSLFHTLMEEMTHKNKNIRILTTPIHHTSFRNIIEQFTKPENIGVFEMNANYNKIVGYSGPNESPFDICVVSHMFGLDMDVGFLKTVKKNNPNCVFIEDRVQGGSFKSKFSNDIFDISLYSTGMDKKPCALGGGIAYLKKTLLLDKLFLMMLTRINSYKPETKINRMFFLSKKIPSYILYNSKICIYVILQLFRIMKLNLNGFIQYYRLKNPGFSHNDYNYNPSPALVNSIKFSIKNFMKIETMYYENSSYFIRELNKQDNGLINLYMPYLNLNSDRNSDSNSNSDRNSDSNSDSDSDRNSDRNSDSNSNSNSDRNSDSDGNSDSDSDSIFYITNLTAYNTISIRKDIDGFIEFMNRRYVPVIKNPTYKLFSHEYPSKNSDKDFNESLVYVPTPHTMTKKEIDYLCYLISLYNNSCGVSN